MDTRQLKRLCGQEVRARQLAMLKEFDEICKENGLLYFVHGGTLLGAVRHKGFIPWDNDIDLMMPREDYLKLTDLFNTDSAHENLRFLCFENDPEYLWQHGRICDRHTWMKTARGYEKLGLSLDIFPLDSQGNDERAARKNLDQIRVCVQLRRMIYQKKYRHVLRFPPCGIFRRLRLAVLMLLHYDEAYWVRRNIALAQRFNQQHDSRYYGCNSDENTMIVCERSFYNGVVYLDFEGMKVPAPPGYHEILTGHYGDYMTPPPEGQRGETLSQMEIYLLP